MKICDYTVPRLNDFRKLCNFTDEEKEFFDYKARNYTNEYISTLMCISESKVSRLVSSVKKKMTNIEKYLDTKQTLSDD